MPGQIVMTSIGDPVRDWRLPDAQLADCFGANSDIGVWRCRPPSAKIGARAIRPRRA